MWVRDCYGQSFSVWEFCVSKRFLAIYSFISTKQCGQIDLWKGNSCPLFFFFFLYQAYYRVMRTINFYNRLEERIAGILLFDIEVMWDVVALSELKQTKNKTKPNKNKAVRMIILGDFFFHFKKPKVSRV